MRRTYFTRFSLAEYVPGPILTRIPFSSWIFLRRALPEGCTVLDLGCGPRSRIRYYKTGRSVGVERYGPYVEMARRLSTHDEVLEADCTELHFDDGAFDAVVAIDLLEHLRKEEGLELIGRMKQWARTVLVIRVPNGFTPGHLVDGNLFQLHQSSYTVTELKGLGFQVIRGIGLKVPGYGSRARLLDVLTRGSTYVARPLSWYYPHIAYDLMCAYYPGGGVTGQLSQSKGSVQANTEDVTV